MSIYMMGRASYAFTLNDVTVVVHAGSPPGTQALSPGSTDGQLVDKPVPPPIKPLVDKPDLLPTKPLEKPILHRPEVLEVAPKSLGELEAALESLHDSGQELTVDVSDVSVDVEGVLQALSAEPRELSVHVIDKPRDDG